MSDKMRWRYGETNRVIASVDSETVIEIGDFVYHENDAAKPASAQADQSSETANQELFVKSFLGVAMQRSRCGDTDPIGVATTGVFEVDCLPSTFAIGDLVGVPEVDSGNALDNQRVVFVLGKQYAIARVAKRVSPRADNVLVDIRSTVMTGGIL